MLKVSDAFNSAFAAPDRELHARVTIGKTVYDSDDLTSINYDSGAMTGEQFSIGSTYMNSAKIIFSHLVEGLKQLDEVLVEFGVLKPDGTVEYVKMGTFIVDDKIQMDRNNNTTTIECMDRMTMLGGTYVSKLTYPARIKDVAIEIANMAGVKANETSFARLSENKINQPTGYTYRDAIGLIAQFQMGFALFDRDGLLDIRTLQDNSFKIDPNQYFLKGLVKNETFFKLNGISCTVVTTSKDENGNETSKTTVLQSGSSSGAQIKLANNVMTQDVLDRMYEALKFTNYYPFSLNWNGNPAVEAGDWLTVEDLQGNEFKVPNMSYTLTYNGGLTATSKADTSVSSPATYSYGGTISNIVNEIGGRESAEGNHIYEGTEDQEPTLSKEGDLWYKHVGPDTEERIYKDGKWEFLTSTKTANDAADAADKASKEAEEAKKQANESVAAANDAVAKAGFATNTANQAKSDAATAGQQAKDALTSAGTAITDAQKALTNSSSAQADSAQARKDSAAAAADASSAIAKANSTASEFGKVSQKADSALASALSAQNDASAAVSQASSAAADSKDAKQIAGSVSQSYKTLTDGSTMTIAELESGLAAKLTKTDLDGYSTQTWTQNQIKMTADGINGTMSSVKSTVDGQTTSINDLKADSSSFKSQFTTVNDTLGKQTTDIGSLQVTSKELTTGFNTLTTDNGTNKNDISQLKQTATEVSSTLETVQTQVKNSAVGTNLINNSNFSSGLSYWSINSGSNKDCKAMVTTDSDGDPCIHITGTGYACGLYRNPVPFNQNQVTIGSVLVKGTGALALVGLEGRPSSNFGTISTESYSKVSSTAEASSTTNNFSIYFNPVDSVIDVYIKFVKLELGSRATDWCLNPTETATVTAVSKISQTVNGIQGTVQNKADQSQVTQLANQISLKADTTALNELKGTVDKQGSEITLNTNSIKLKADQSSVDTLKGTVDKQGSAIDVNTKTIALKANQSTVDTLTGRVSTAEGKITVQADQIALTVSKTELTSKLNGYATQSWSEGKISAAKNEISASVETVKNTVDNWQVGGTNLIVRTGEIVNSMLSADGGKLQGFNQASVMCDKIAVTAGEKLTFHQEQPVDTAYCFRYNWYDADGTYLSRAAQAGKGLFTVTVPANAAALWVSYPNVGRVKVERGTTATDWSPAPEDQATVDWTKSQLDITDKKITAGITTVTNTLNNNIASATANMATTTWTNTQIDAAKTAINLSVEQSITTSENTLNSNIANATADMATQTWTQGQIKTTADSINLNVSKVQTDLSGTKTQFAALGVKVDGIQTTVSGKADQSQVTQLAGQITSVVGDVSANSSQITQMKADINLRVKVGDVINQINISPESILIAGQKVHITGQTRIDNAVIKDAMIADIKADKITAGTLNAANVDVINLNANNITTGTIKGANLSLNLNTGEVLFQKGSIKSANGNLNLDISKGTMAVINEYKSGFYFEDGKLVLNDGWLEGTSSQPKYGSLEYNANYFTVNGLAVKGTEGVTIGTPGYNPLVMFSPVKESGIAIDKKHLEIGSVGPTIISSGNEFFMNLWTQPPFIAVGTTADGNHMTTSDPGSRISLYAEYVHIKSAYSKTASGSANVIVSEDGALVRSTSASKYKTDIIRTNIPDYGEKLLNLPTATWTDIAETKRYRDDPVNQMKPTRNFGMIAEDLADAGLEMLVVRGTDGELEGINYDRIGPALIPVIAKLKNEVETLKQKIGGKSA